MNFRDRWTTFCQLSPYYRWELLGVYAGLRCSACGWWKWQSTCCTVDHAWKVNWKRVAWIATFSYIFFNTGWCDAHRPLPVCNPLKIVSCEPQ